MYRLYRGQAVARRLLLGVAAGAVALGLIARGRGTDGFLAQPLIPPTATPMLASFDETVETREMTLPAETWYAIQTGVFSTREAAEQKADAYAGRGAPGYVARDGEKWRVFLACYGSREDAASVRDRLSGNQQVETYLYEWAAPELRLRMSGMAGQLDVAEAGLALMRQSAARLRDDASRLDAGELTAAEETAVLDSLDGQVTLWADTARKRFARPYPALVETLLGWAEDWQNRRKALDTSDVTALSAALKAQAMDLHAWDADFRQRMLAP